MQTERNWKCVANHSTLPDSNTTTTTNLLTENQMFGLCEMGDFTVIIL
jgi:hypothetical protein